MNYKKLPKHNEVQQIGDFQLVELTDENREYMAEIALSMYSNEPCRICGELLTIDDLHNGAIYAGYSVDNKSRTAHSLCWNKNIEKGLWAYPLDAKD